ncbi:NADH-ubiquinone oxidoreductase 9.5 kDa subunit [Drepanopeziza brunnea f. sp. 'multigermtubi' MB_m1]|uniref:NADH-ubiquinone oxidoreductase 9.5 kDa subunit n=1 Tax=Marssonina brunnea f. sp. multigermtubi (strain MB_m1) TaxID=1072389 RepID=K1Y167_MARBU|nr:NADH-ubiquinone oxidoreductase 9.5 kDa subunit [Drepanopeziza brunnea f. sp. 'multigermtubi' MB_m1]EKD18899.1 NADH-ubiquinone oxidoreductase 9.5 kDa subunit [Drepanopeziza brunnea f. sp. 'multigermtubi' MB_m1]
MSNAIPRFWSQPIRYLRWASIEKPAIFYSLIIGSMGPVVAMTVPPIRNMLGDHKRPEIPLTYPSSSDRTAKEARRFRGQVMGWGQTVEGLVEGLGCTYPGVIMEASTAAARKRRRNLAWWAWVHHSLSVQRYAVGLGVMASLLRTRLWSLPRDECGGETDLEAEGLADLLHLDVGLDLDAKLESEQKVGTGMLDPPPPATRPVLSKEHLSDPTWLRRGHDPTYNGVSNSRLGPSLKDDSVVAQRNCDQVRNLPGMCDPVTKDNWDPETKNRAVKLMMEANRERLKSTGRAKFIAISKLLLDSSQLLPKRSLWLVRDFWFNKAEQPMLLEENCFVHDSSDCFCVEIYHSRD